MAQIASEWEQNREAEQLAAKLVEMYPQKLIHVDPDQIAVAMITNKERPESAKWYAKINGVQAPVSLFCSKTYIISFYHDTWEMLNAAQRAFVLMDMLLRIPEEMDGKVLKDDLTGLKVLIDRFGTNPLDDPKLPDLAATKEFF